jgi:hypothetical protein
MTERACKQPSMVLGAGPAIHGRAFADAADAIQGIG